MFKDFARLTKHKYLYQWLSPKFAANSRKYSLVIQYSEKCLMKMFSWNFGSLEFPILVPIKDLILLQSIRLSFFCSLNTSNIRLLWVRFVYFVILRTVLIVPIVTKRSHILKKTCSWRLQVCLSMCNLFVTQEQKLW